MYSVPSLNLILMESIVDAPGRRGLPAMHVSFIGKIWVVVCMVNVNIMADCSGPSRPYPWIIAPRRAVDTSGGRQDGSRLRAVCPTSSATN